MFQTRVIYASFYFVQFCTKGLHWTLRQKSDTWTNFNVILMLTLNYYCHLRRAPLVRGFLTPPSRACAPAALLHALRLRLGLRLLALQSVRGLQRPTCWLRSPGPPPLAAAEPRAVTPGRRDGDAHGGDPLSHDLQAPGPRRCLWLWFLLFEFASLLWMQYVVIVEMFKFNDKNEEK